MDLSKLSLDLRRVTDNEVQLVGIETGVMYALISHDSVVRITFTDVFTEMPCSFEKKWEVVAALFAQGRNVAQANNLPDRVELNLTTSSEQSVRAMAGLLMCASPHMSFA